MKIPFRQLGLTTQGLRKSLTEGAAISAVIIALTVAVVVASRVVDSIPPIELKFDPVGSVAYLLHSFLQELIGRGLMQSSFQRFLMDEKGIRSVLLSGTLFGVFHIHFGLPAVGLTMLSCFVFGFFYLRHQNLAGVTLLHYAIGACAFITGLL
jgi:membrane protease YdiL (CAAX protease family)